MTNNDKYIIRYSFWCTELESGVYFGLYYSYAHVQSPGSLYGSLDHSDRVGSHMQQSWGHTIVKGRHVETNIIDRNVVRQPETTTLKNIHPPWPPWKCKWPHWPVNAGHSKQTIGLCGIWRQEKIRILQWRKLHGVERFGDYFWYSSANRGTSLQPTSSNLSVESSYLSIHEPNSVLEWQAIRRWSNLTGLFFKWVENTTY